MRGPAELSLFEKGDDQVLRRGQPGEPFAGIADNWRVFFTANLKGTGNKLSSAFLNRVVLICLEPLDAVCAWLRCCTYPRSPRRPYIAHSVVRCVPAGLVGGHCKFP
jgi:hypothetical protein